MPQSTDWQRVAALGLLATGLAWLGGSGSVGQGGAAIGGPKQLRRDAPPAWARH